jgi:thiamine transporter
MKKIKLIQIVETGIMLSLATVLSMFKIYEFPFGGSVTLLSMLPIIIIALRYRAVWGITTGVIYGLIQLLLDSGKMAGWGLSLQAIFGTITFDYLVAFGLLGLAGLFVNKKWGPYVGTAFAIFLRFCSHVLSGVLIFGSVAPKTISLFGYTFNTDPFAYSLIYNGAYMLPELVLTLLAIILFPRLIKLAGYKERYI